MNTFPSLTGRVVVGAALVLTLGLVLFGQDAGDRGASVRDRQGESSPATTDNGPPTASASGAESNAGAELLRQARENLIDKPLEARIEEDVILGRRRFKASGRYVQGRDLKLRLEFTVKIGQSEGTLLEVCDGEVLWTQQKIGDRPRITRRNVGAILEAAAQAGHVDDNLLTAELGLGGLAALLASIEEHMVFDPPRQETIDGQTVHVIEGRWNEEFLERYRPAAEGAAPAAADPAAKTDAAAATDAAAQTDEAARTGEAPADGDEAAPAMPAHVPERIQIYLDSEKYPRRIVYRKQSPDGAYDFPMLTLDFKDIRVNGPVAASEFQFEPERGVFQEDITRQYLDRLRPAAAQP